VLCLLLVVVAVVLVLPTVLVILFMFKSSMPRTRGEVDMSLLVGDPFSCSIFRVEAGLQAAVVEAKRVAFLETVEHNGN
jgi:flagellar basal body-associated protein FliL